MGKQGNSKQDSPKHGRKISPKGGVVVTELETVHRKSVPVDQGWAWFVLIGAVLVMGIFIGVMKASGILFVTFQQRYNANAAMTSLLSTVQNVVQSVTALFVMTVGTTLTSRRVLVFIGGILICLSYIITAMSENILWLMLSYGVLLGIGSACVVPTTVAVLGQHFDKRRGLANSLAVSGGSLGGLLLAPAITLLLDSFGYQGCMLILAGIHLNICVSAVLFRPLSFYSSARKTTKGKPTLYTAMTKTKEVSLCNESKERSKEIQSFYTAKETTQKEPLKFAQTERENSERLITDIDTQMNKRDTDDLRKTILVRRLISEDSSTYVHKEPENVENNTVLKPSVQTINNDEKERKSLLDRKATSAGSLSNIPDGLDHIEDVDVVLRPRSETTTVIVPMHHHNVEVESLLLSSVPCIPGAVHTSPYSRPRSSTETSVHRLIKSMTHLHKGDTRAKHSSDYIAGSHMDLSGFIKSTPTSSMSRIGVHVHKTKDGSNKQSVLKTIRNSFDINLLKNPLFLLMEVAFMLLCSGSLMCMVYVAPYATDVGLHPRRVATLISIYSGIDLCARILIGILADLRWFRRSTIVGTCAVISGIACSFLRLYTTYELLILFSAVLGMVSGAYFALSAVVIVDYLSVEKLHSVLGYATLLNGASVAAGYYAMGLLREATGTYVSSFYLSAAMNLVGGVILFTLPIVEKRQKKSLEKGRQRKEHLKKRAR